MSSLRLARWRHTGQRVEYLHWEDGEATGLADNARQQLDARVQRAERSHSQRRKDKHELHYALHAPESECIGKVQGVPALRVRRQGQPSSHAPAWPDGGRAQLPRQPVRQPHTGRGDRADSTVTLLPDIGVKPKTAIVD